MDKCKQFKKRTWKLLFKNLIIFGTLVVVTIVGVLAWFSINTTVQASGMEISAKAPVGLDVAIVDPSLSGTALQNHLKNNNNWHSGSIDFTATDYPFLSELNLLPVTGNGISFIKPPQTQYSAVAAVQTSVTWNATNTQTNANWDYISFDMYFRTTGSGKKTVLDGETFFGPLNTSASMGNQINGVSPNSVIGAARMAILDNTYSTRKLLWIPAPHLYYDGVDLDSNVIKTSNTYGLYYTDTNNNDVYLNTDGTYNHGYYSSDKTRSIIPYMDYTNANFNPATKVTANTSKDYMLHNDTNLANLSNRLTTYTGEANTSTNYNYFANKVRVNMWIEGEDPESRATQVSGEFKVNLKLKIADVS